MIKKICAILLLAPLLLNCQQSDETRVAEQQEEQETFKRRILSFGTQIDVTLYGIDEKQADQAIQQIEQQLDVMHEQWHAWRRSSLTELNQKLTSQQPFEADQAVLPLVIESQQLYLKSRGLFNPAIGKLIELWGFYRDNPQDNDRVPPDAEIQKLLDSNPNMSDIKINGNILTGTNADIQIDFGGYAKGYGVDRLVEQLKSQGIHNALINAGGDLRAIGRPGNRNWIIAIQHPDEQQSIGWMELNDDESVFSSGDYQRKFSKDGKRYHHIIDPRTGYPTEHARATTVVHHNGAVADAAATALMVAAEDEWLDIARSMELKHFLVVDKDGKIYSDKLFSQRINLIDKATEILILGTL